MKTINSHPLGLSATCPLSLGEGEKQPDRRFRYNWVRVLVFLLVFTLSLISTAEELKIYGVEVERHKQYDNYYVETNGVTLPKAKMLGNRLIFDFKGVKVDKPQTIKVAKSGRVASIRIGQFSSDPLIARVVFDLKREIKYETASLYGKGKILVEISDSGTAVPLVAQKEPQKSKKLALKGKTIIVDPGHGGDDPGAMGPGGVQEKDINLKTAKYLAGYLRERGAKVYLTRKSDVRHKLKDIVDFSNRAKGDIYIGMHFNSIDNPKISGTETHYYTPQSFKLACAVHNKLLSGIRREDRGIKRTMLYTVHHTKMPAIIVEPIYMTHFQDGLLIKSKSFQKEVARDIALGVEDYFNER
jgi:N-acetylmuramoyl-L-alanine amidase